MGTEELGDTLLYLDHVFQVHRSMCSELKRLTDSVAAIFPQIEAARPGCSSGIRALCLLNNSIDKSKKLIEYFSESSKLYLAITGETMLLRCQNMKNMLEKSLSQLHNMVPVMLSAQISHVLDDLKATKFSLNPSDEEAGKALLGLLHKDDSSSQTSEKETIQFACSKLQIASRKEIILETRAIKRVLSKVEESHVNKRKILKYLLLLLKRYGNLLITEGANDDVVTEFHGEEDDNNDTKIDVSERLKCPISGKIMFDPVVASSGVTFERMWIQKWFDEGNSTCPKTGKKITDFSLNSNKAVKELTWHWCLRHGVSVEDPTRTAFYSDVSSTSIASIGSTISDIHLPHDLSNVSVESSDSTTMSSLLELFPRLPELSWEEQCSAVDDVKHQMQCNEYVSDLRNLVEPTIAFLSNALNRRDSRALRTGSEILLMMEKRNRNQFLCLISDSLSLLTSILGFEVIDEVLSIVEALSSQNPYISKLSDSGITLHLAKFLASSEKKHQETAVRIFLNMSIDKESCSQILGLGCIPKLVPFINDAKLGRNCIALLRNLCAVEEARVAVAETDGCVAAIAVLLEDGGEEEQEHAVAVILYLCSMRVEYCHLFMNEMIIPSLVYISNNGSEKGKAKAFELLRHLRDVNFEEDSESFEGGFPGGKEGNLGVEEKVLPVKPRGSSRKSVSFFRKLIASSRRRKAT